MKVLYDHQIFTIQKYGGISRYFYELIKNFNKQRDINIYTSLFLSNNYYIRDRKDIYYNEFLPNGKFKYKQRLQIIINKLISIYNLKKQKYDIFHPTYYDTYFLKYIDNTPFVLTVYDMIHEKLNNSSNDDITKNKILLCEKASKIIAISKSTKKDFLSLGCPFSPIMCLEFSFLNLGSKNFL